MVSSNRSDPAPRLLDASYTNSQVNKRGGLLINREVQAPLRVTIEVLS